MTDLRSKNLREFIASLLILPPEKRQEALRIGRALQSGSANSIGRDAA